MQINFFGPTCLLSRALPLPHRLQAAVPVEQLEDGHQLLELEHRLPPVGAQHEPEGADPGVGGVNGALRPALNDEQNIQLADGREICLTRLTGRVGRTANSTACINEAMTEI